MMCQPPKIYTVFITQVSESYLSMWQAGSHGAVRADEDEM